MSKLKLALSFLLVNVLHAQTRPAKIIGSGPATSRSEVTPLKSEQGQPAGVQIRIIGPFAGQIYKYLKDVPQAGVEKKASHVLCLNNGNDNEARCLFWIHPSGQVTAGLYDQSYPGTFTREQKPPFVPASVLSLSFEYEVGDAVWNALTQVPESKKPGIGGKWKESPQVSCGEVFGIDFKTVAYHGCNLVLDTKGNVSSRLPKSAIPIGL